VLLTVGSRFVHLYAQAARESGCELWARVLPNRESLEACERAGLAPERIVGELGPFSVEANLELLRRVGATVLVSKDGGEKGGVREKLEAARHCGCRFVAVARPETLARIVVCDVEALLQALPED
jgi:precorrin-6x reductase